MLTVEQIAARLADRFMLLSSAERMALPRHRTLRAAIDWSHDLLPPAEKVLLRRLSVFASWPLEMAEDVCAGSQPGEELAGGDILNLLTGLADRSFVIAEPDADGRIRYRMRRAIRPSAAARLDEAGEAQRQPPRFRDCAVGEMEHAALIGMAILPATWPERVETFRRFDAETANMRQILTWCLDVGDVESGLRMCSAMRPVWIGQGSFAEGAAWMDAFLYPHHAALPGGVLGPALIGRAQLALASDPADASQRAKAGLELCRGPGLEFWAASALNLLAEAALHAGQGARTKLGPSEPRAPAAAPGGEIKAADAPATAE